MASGSWSPSHFLKSTQQHISSITPLSNDCNSPTTRWLCRASKQRGVEVNALEGKMGRESSTKDVCNAIRVNKRLFNEEALLPVTLPVPLFCVWSKSSRASELGLPQNQVSRVRAQSNHLSEDIFFYEYTSCKGQTSLCTSSVATSVGFYFF